MKKVVHLIMFALVEIIFGVALVSCQYSVDKNRTWSVYKADLESSSYSPLTQINKKNVQQLRLAWRFIPNDARKDARIGSSECNPIIIDGVMYITSA